MATLYIRNLPVSVHRKVRSQAAAMGLTLAEWVARAAESMDNPHNVEEDKPRYWPDCEGCYQKDSSAEGDKEYCRDCRRNGALAKAKEG